MTEYTYGRNKTLLFKLQHEVRQALHSMMGMLELAAEGPSAAARADYLSRCRSSADSLLQIAKDVAELAESEPCPMPASVFEVRTMAEEVSGVMQAMAARKGLKLTLSIEPGVPAYVLAERETIQDMLRRIVANSLKFTTQGEIGLTVSSPPANVSGETRLEFEVRDTGCGISAEMQEEIGQPEGGPSVGLGLSIVRKRLSRLQGECSVASSPRGTVVRIALPVKTASYEPPRLDWQTSQEEPRSGLPMNLLVAEDSNDSFNVFRVYVSGEGHTVTRALNGEEAVEKAKSGEFDLIVMDIDMPVMDGYTATRAIREWETRERRPRIPIVMLSAEDGERQRRTGASAGCSAYLTKPALRQDVLRALHHFHGARR